MRGHLWYNITLALEEQSKLKHVLKIIYKVFIHRLEQELQQCRADKGLLEYNRDRLFDRYYNKFKDRKASHIKWKNRERNSQQLILNLQAQILLLQNNPPNMAEARRLPVLKLNNRLLQVSHLILVKNLLMIILIRLCNHGHLLRGI